MIFVLNIIIILYEKHHFSTILNDKHNHDISKKNKPSFLGFAPILLVKSVNSWYLLYVAITRFISLDSKAKTDPITWNINNWLLYSLRRYLVDYFLNWVHLPTQAVPVLNWILNLIPLALSYVNIFVL